MNMNTMNVKRKTYPVKLYAFLLTLCVLFTLPACDQLQIPTDPPGAATPESPATRTATPRPSSTPTPDAALTADAARFRETVLAFQTQSAAENATERAATARPTATPAAPGVTPTPLPLPGLEQLSPANASRLGQVAAFRHADFERVEWHPGGRVFTVYTAGEITVYRADALLAIRAYPRAGFTQFALSPDGTHSILARADGTLFVDDLETGAAGVLAGHAEAVTAVALSPDNRLAASLGVDGNLKLWDTAGGTELVSFFTRFYFDYASYGDWTAFSPDGARVAAYASESSSILIWDTAELIANAATGAAPPAFAGWQDHAAPVVTYLLSPDWETVAWFGRGTLLFMDSAGSKLGEAIHHEDFITLPQFTRDSSRLFLANAQTINTLYAGVILAYDTATQELLQTFAGPDFVSAWMFSPDEAELAAGYANGALMLWDAGTGRLKIELAGHAGRIQAAAYSPDGRMLATAGEDGAIRLWGASSGGELTALPASPVAGHWLAFSPDGRALVVVSTEGEVVFYGVEP
jgi:WD40 repeat protein